MTASSDTEALQSTYPISLPGGDVDERLQKLEQRITRLDQVIVELRAQNIALMANMTSKNARPTWLHFAHLSSDAPTDIYDHVYDDGDAYGSPEGSGTWVKSCAEAVTFAGSSTAIVLKVVMGEVIDYFRPKGSATFCQMLLGGNHGMSYEWSNDLVTWRVPAHQPQSTFDQGYKGGSESGWPAWRRITCRATRVRTCRFGGRARASSVRAAVTRTPNNNQLSDGTPCGTHVNFLSHTCCCVVVLQLYDSMYTVNKAISKQKAQSKITHNQLIELKRHVPAMLVAKLIEEVGIQPMDDVDNFSCEDGARHRWVLGHACRVGARELNWRQAQVVQHGQPISG